MEFDRRMSVLPAVDLGRGRSIEGLRIVPQWLRGSTLEIGLSNKPILHLLPTG